MKRAKEIKFERNAKNGEFILPPITNFRTTRDRQRVVRGYVGAVYSAYIPLTVFLLFSELRDRRIHGETKGDFPLPFIAGRGPKYLFTRVCPGRVHLK
jgi:hypothetical protein